MGNKMKHLEFIQAVITRMAGNSFLIKGWAVTIVAAIFALAAAGGKPSIIPVAYLPVIVFWTLDGYFLRQERLYRKLYDAVRVLEEEQIDFSLNASIYSDQVEGLIGVCWSITLRLFHGGLLASVIAVNVLARFL